MNSLECKQPIPCPPEVEPEKEVYPPATPEFTVCTGDYTLAWDGTRLRKTRTRTTPDGEYGSMVVTDGCVTAYGLPEVPTYTPPYCNPNPPPCGEGEGGGVSVQVSPAAGNQLSDSALGLYAKAYISAGTGVSVTGSGTQAQPYVVSSSATGGSDISLVEGAGIKIEEIIPGQKTIGVKDGALNAGIYGGFSVDRHGFITGYNPALSDTTVAEVIGGLDITVTTAAGIATVEHNRVAAAAIHTIGDSEVTVSQTGHVINVEKLTAAVRRRPIIDLYRIEVRVPEATPTDFDAGYLEVEAFDAKLTLISKTFTPLLSTYVIQPPAYIDEGDYQLSVNANAGADNTTITITPAGLINIQVSHTAENTKSLLARISMTIREA